MKVLSVVGNRPQFIKSGPVSVALRDAGIDEVVLHTGQHWDAEMSAVFFEELGLPEPAYRLDLRTADPEAMRPAIRGALERGAAGLGARLRRHELDARRRGGGGRGVAVAHVEAGLRSGDLSMPEERNRIAVDGIAELLLPPDERSAAIARAARASRADRGRRRRDGRRVLPASRRSRASARGSSSGSARAGAYVVATIHREANVRAGAARAHRRRPRPRSREPRRLPRASAHAVAARRACRRTSALVEPLGYLDMAALASQARVIVTDSGGLQKEAYWYGVPCVTARPSTEWVDTVEVGANVLVDDDPERLAAAVADAAHARRRGRALYGDGHASERVAAALRG